MCVFGTDPSYIETRLFPQINQNEKKGRSRGGSLAPQCCTLEETTLNRIKTKPNPWRRVSHPFPCFVFGLINDVAVVT